MIPDAYNTQAYNRASYVENNPMAFIDPTGHVDETVIVKRFFSRMQRVRYRVKVVCATICPVIG